MSKVRRRSNKRKQDRGHAPVASVAVQTAPVQIQSRPSKPVEFSIQDLRAHLKRYRVYDALGWINSLSTAIAYGAPPPGVQKRAGALSFDDITLTQWDLALVAKELILCSNDHRSGDLRTDREVFKRAIGIAQNLRDPGLNSDPSTTKTQRLSSLIRIAYLQFRHQGWGETALYRTYWLYEHVWRQLPQTFDLEQAALNVFGMPLPSFLILGFGLLSLATEDEFWWVKIDALANVTDPRLEFLRAVATPENLQRFWALVATDYDGFRRLREQFKVDDVYARFELNPLELRPAVLTKEPKRYVVPSITYLLLRLSDGIYHDFFTHYLRERRHHEFSSFFGWMFQEYVGEQLKIHCTSDRVLGEREYYVGRERWEGPDWILIEGESAVVIECKAARLVVAGRTIADELAIQQTVRGKLVDVVRLFSEKIGHIQQRPDVWPELVGVREFHCAVVTADPWWPPAIFIEVVEQELAAQGLTSVPFHLLAVDDLEDLVPLAAGGFTISEILKARVERGEQGHFLGEEIARLAKQRGISCNNRLLETAKEAFLSTVAPVPRANPQLGHRTPPGES